MFPPLVEGIYASKYITPTVLNGITWRFWATPDSHCLQNNFLRRISTVVTASVWTTLTIITQYSFVVILGTGFLANPLQNAENSAKFASRPYVQCGCAPVFTKTRNSSAALRGRILCSVSPEFKINTGTVDQNQFSRISWVCVPPNLMSDS